MANNQRPIPEYPAAPTPEELKSHSKKYMLLGGILVGVLLVAALVFVLWPEAPPEILVVEKPVEVVEEFVPFEPPLGLVIYDVKVCSELDPNYRCLSEKNVFTQDDEFGITYKIEGFGTEGTEDTRVIRLVKLVKLTDEFANEVDYPATELSRELNVTATYDFEPPYISSGEKLKAKYFPPGTYFFQITIADKLTGDADMARVGFDIT